MTTVVALIAVKREVAVPILGRFFRGANVKFKYTARARSGIRNKTGDKSLYNRRLPGEGVRKKLRQVFSEDEEETPGSV